MKDLLYALLIAAAGAGIWYVVKKRKAPRINDESTIVVGTNATYPPFAYLKNGEPKGIELDIMREIARRLDKKIEIIDMSFDMLLLEAQSGRVDVIAAGLTPTVERGQHVFFTEPYIAHDPMVVITLASEHPQSIQDLKGKEVIVNDGFTAENYMEKQSGIELKRLATVAEAFLALQNGRGYAFVSAKSAVEPFFKKFGTDKFSVLTVPNVFDSYAIAVSKARPELFKDIEEELEELKEDGTLTKIIDKANTESGSHD